MATVVSPLITQNQVQIVAKGYVKGTLSSYAGLVVSSSGPNGPNTSTTFFSTQGFWMDWAMVDLHTKYSQGAFGQSVGAGSLAGVPTQGGVQIGGVRIDQSVYNYIADYFAANG